MLRPSRRSVRLPLFPVLAAVVLVAAQAAIDSSAINIYCSFICAIAACATFVHCLRYEVVGRFPISSFALLGFSVTAYALPLLAQTFSGRPLIYNLLVPQATFEATVAFQMVILAAHMAYTGLRGLQQPSRWLAWNLLRPLWVFRMPTALELWCLGLVGTGATWFSRVLFSDQVQYGDVGGKFMQALVVYIVAPFFIPFRGYFLSRPVSNPPLTAPLLAGYFALVVVTAIFFNARVIFAVVLFTVLLSTGMMLAMRRIRFSRRTKALAVIGALAAAPLVSAGQDLATAMQVARLQRGHTDAAGIAAETLRAFGDKERLAAMRKQSASMTADAGYSGFSETYLESEFFQRLTYTKYTDLTMAASVRLADFQRSQIRRDAYESIVSILPTPMINLLGLDVRKENRNFSTGDVYANLAFNQELGGYRTGSSITNAVDVLDKLWIPTVFVIAIILFIQFDSYCLVMNGKVMISGIVFILLYEIMGRGLVYESLRSLVDNMTRAYVQALFVYTVLTLGIRLALSPIVALWTPRATRAAPELTLIRVPPPHPTS